jgi:uncharacterized membrane protein
MEKLIAIAFKEKHGAMKALAKIREMENNYLLSTHDAVIATRKKNGKVKLNQSVNLIKMGATQGALWGSLVGLILTGPLGMILLGGTSAGFGAIIGSVNDYGINDTFMRKLARELQPGSSALFFLVSDMTVDKVMEQMKSIDGTLIHTSLSQKVEEKLKSAVEKEDEEVFVKFQ